MARSGARRGSGTRERAATRDRIVQAAIDTLQAEGFSGASARAIAGRAGCSQAAVFYHFDGVNDLLLAALDETARRRLARYRTAVEEVADLGDLMRIAADVYREDLAAGHLKVLAEMIAGASSSPELGPEIAARLDPWFAFARDAFERVAGGAIGALLPTDQAAYAVVALYLGMELLTHLDGDPSRAEALFDSGARLVALVGGLVGTQVLRPAHGGGEDA